MSIKIWSIEQNLILFLKTKLIKQPLIQNLMALASMVWKFVNERSKKVLGSGLKENQQLADEFHKPIIEKFKRRKVYIWRVYLADMSLISKFNKGIKYLLCVIDFFSRYAWVVGLKDKKGVGIVNRFQKILNSSKRKPNKIWVDHGSEFYNNVFKTFLKNNDIEMYSTHNEGKSVVAERFIRTLKNKIYKHMTTVGKNVYFDVLEDIVNKYNNTYHNSIKMKPEDVTDIVFVECNWSEELFVIKKIKNTVLWTYVISD